MGGARKRLFEVWDCATLSGPWGLSRVSASPHRSPQGWPKAPPEPLEIQCATSGGRSRWSGEGCVTWPSRYLPGGPSMGSSSVYRQISDTFDQPPHRFLLALLSPASESVETPLGDEVSRSGQYGDVLMNHSEERLPLPSTEDSGIQQPPKKNKPSCPLFGPSQKGRQVVGGWSPWILEPERRSRLLHLFTFGRCLSLSEHPLQSKKSNNNTYLLGEKTQVKHSVQFLARWRHSSYY